MSALPPPTNPDMPLFVYGALKPGMPAFEQLRKFVDGPPKRDKITGSLYIRDGLPLLSETPAYEVEGFLLCWKHGCGATAYQVVQAFEPKEHYKWIKCSAKSGVLANVLVGKQLDKGGAQLHENPNSWQLYDDPAFGHGLDTVQEIVDELGFTGTQGNPEKSFFRAQMAYLLLWSILERLTALCFGASMSPTMRVTKLHTLSGMAEIVGRHVKRDARVTDSRAPTTFEDLDGANPKACFAYYYQIRSNLSHRGKGIFNESEMLKDSLSELNRITKDYLGYLQAMANSV